MSDEPIPATEFVVTDRRAQDRRGRPDRRKRDIPVAVERRSGKDRRLQGERRRQVDPTTCEKEYSDEEIMFMKAMDQYKRANRRPFPTWSEVLEVLRAWVIARPRRPPPCPACRWRPQRTRSKWSGGKRAAVHKAGLGQRPQPLSRGRRLFWTHSSPIFGQPIRSNNSVWRAWMCHSKQASPDPSFPSSAWERTSAKLRFASGSSTGREAELRGRRSQALLGNEGRGGGRNPIAHFGRRTPGQDG